MNFTLWQQDLGLNPISCQTMHFTSSISFWQHESEIRHYQQCTKLVSYTIFHFTEMTSGNNGNNFSSTRHRIWVRILKIGFSNSEFIYRFSFYIPKSPFFSQSNHQVYILLWIFSHTSHTNVAMGSPPKMETNFVFACIRVMHGNFYPWGFSMRPIFSLFINFIFLCKKNI